uniref:Uncharacterized protein n=1 Tax=Chromera velia CCMP2878 TaxID=1169474 RepID=A0A0G4H775_9ALVE|eukprot:Cvel_25011.t1-p1 / transcript=Cvel_25011.t1 / gene=Cvel_25011 / organism=Chromera_velia_CCMP2878 / gene_product=hypothetical protein / transcript_product=hypothetical protein / location=Cvel_scaffold2773:3026-3712(-) / protein_length=229 / sequence_SO=supercontig / SO=protein_coding / is_pseudo=false
MEIRVVPKEGAPLFLPISDLMRKKPHVKGNESESEGGRKETTSDSMTPWTFSSPPSLAFFKIEKGEGSYDHGADSSLNAFVGAHQGSTDRFCLASVKAVGHSISSMFAADSPCVSNPAFQHRGQGELGSRGGGAFKFIVCELSFFLSSNDAEEFASALIDRARGMKNLLPDLAKVADCRVFRGTEIRKLCDLRMMHRAVAQDCYDLLSRWARELDPSCIRSDPLNSIFW